MKSKILKSTVAIIFAIVIVVCFMIPCFASENLSFHITIVDNPFGNEQGIYCSVKFKYTSNGQVITSASYTDGDSSVLVGDVFSVFSVDSSSIPSELGYTGCSIRIYTSNYEQDLTSVLLVGIEPIDGIYYADFGQEVMLSSTWSGQGLEFIFTAMNIVAYEDNQTGYAAGYRNGKRDGASQFYNGPYMDLLRQYNLLQESVGGATQEQLDQARADGYNQAAGDKEVVANTIESAMNGVGGVLSELLAIQFFGIPISYVFAMVLLIPLAIFIIKIFMKKG